MVDFQGSIKTITILNKASRDKNISGNIES